jgi:hypothetical protein
VWIISLALLLQTGEVESSIKSDEEVTFFPTYGHLDEEGTTWIVAIHGWIYEPEVEGLARRRLLDQLRRSLGLDEPDAGTAIFEERARAFLVDNERGKTISLRLGGTIHRVGISGPNGHFRGNLRLSAEEAVVLMRGRGWITFRAVTREGDKRDFSGRAQLIDKTGLSVISDIDDTIKDSEVSDRKALLANTFLREFRAVPGMADAFRLWGDRGAAFHYVSASPWQLYRPLAEFLRENGFPEGTFHLKDFRWKDTSFFNLFESPERTKREAIEPILGAFPRRRFFLVGDSGERDPEVYGELARKYPRQIVRILIRDVTGEGADSGRYSKSFKDLPRDRWTVFRDAGEIGDG